MISVCYHLKYTCIFITWRSKLLEITFCESFLCFPSRLVCGLSGRKFYVVLNFSEFGANTATIPSFLIAFELKVEELSHFSLFRNRSELLDVMLISNIQKCFPTDHQPALLYNTFPNQRLEICLTYIDHVFKCGKQLNCSRETQKKSRWLRDFWLARGEGGIGRCCFESLLCLKTEQHFCERKAERLLLGSLSVTVAWVVDFVISTCEMAC